MSNDPFMTYLYSLKYESTGNLAALRRACGQPWARNGPYEIAYFYRWDIGPVDIGLAADFLSLTIAAQYSSEVIKHSGLRSNKNSAKRTFWPFRSEGSIGKAWARYCRVRDPEKDPATFYRRRQEALANGNNPERPPSIHERFRTLLDAELEVDGTGELAYRMRGLMRMLVAEGIPIDVIQLAHDLRGWRAANRHVQEQWARAFYAPPVGGKSASEETDEQYEDTVSEMQDEEEDGNAD
jgi:hypothetical protein